MSHCSARLPREILINAQKKMILFSSFSDNSLPWFDSTACVGSLSSYRKSPGVITLIALSQSQSDKMYISFVCGRCLQLLRFCQLWQLSVVTDVKYDRCQYDIYQTSSYDRCQLRHLSNYQLWHSVSYDRCQLWQLSVMTGFSYDRCQLWHPSVVTTETYQGMLCMCSLLVACTHTML